MTTPTSILKSRWNAVPASAFAAGLLALTSGYDRGATLEDRFHDWIHNATTCWN